MKPITLLALAGLASAATTRADDESADYLNFIIQVQNDEHRTTHKLNDISPTGNGNALEGVDSSSVFQLWTIHRTKATEYLLDEKIVSSYHPEATITITTGDDYEGVPRTRVDQPFTVSYTVNGLVTNDPKVQDAAKSVVLEHKATNYVEQPAPAQQPEGGLLGGIVGDTLGTVLGAVKSLQSVVDKNGATRETRLTTLEGPDLTQVSGEEEFTIFARPDFGVEESHQLANAKVQIWPIARGEMTGIDGNKRYLELPDVHVELEELYPDSTTYVRVYKGEPRTNPAQVHIINTSYVIVDDATPQDRKFSLSGKELGITEKGDYTLEIIHETPFGADILSQTYPLRKKGSLKVIGSLNTSE